MTLGPTWERDADGRFVAPEYSLGWGIVAWAATWLTNDEGEPFVLTPEQFRFTLWFYAVDENGKFLYQDATLQRCKGWG